MAATKQQRRKAPPPEEGAVRAVFRLLGPLKIIAGAIVGTAAVVLAWNQLGWWKPAGTTYVDVQVKEQAVILSKKIDDQGTSVNKRIDNVDANTLQNRLETITAAKNRDIAEKTDLELKNKLAGPRADPGYLQMLQTRTNFLDDQIGQLNNQISGLQTAIAGKNAAPGK